MLKLIATDMDGTLLNSNKEMPERTFEMIDELHSKGITFAVASGRQYQSLLRLYEGMTDKIVVIAENGGIILDQGEMIFNDIMDPSAVREITETVSQIPGLLITICGLKSAYMFEENVMQYLTFELAHGYFPVRTIIKSLDEIPVDEQIVKFAIFDTANNAKVNIYENLKHLEGKYQIAVSGAEWTDVMNAGINKGLAIQKLQERLGASKEETMVFGDERNDYEMMEQAYYSYAMANAVPAIKEVANFMAPSHDEQGVICVLENFLSMTKEMDVKT